MSNHRAAFTDMTAPYSRPDPEVRLTPISSGGHPAASHVQSMPFRRIRRRRIFYLAEIRPEYPHRWHREWHHSLPSRKDETYHDAHCHRWQVEFRAARHGPKIAVGPRPLCRKGFSNAWPLSITKTTRPAEYTKSVHAASLEMSKRKTS